ncbi:MAG: hypothetical protein AAF789_07940 [Bacteroidota bacterium]
MKNKAFTIYELLVSMLIASLILTFGWQVVVVVNRYQEQLQKKTSAINDLQRLKTQIKRDFYQADSFEKGDNTIQIKREAQTILYEFTQIVTRKYSTSLDTLASGLDFSCSEKSVNVLEICLTSAQHVDCFQVATQYSVRNALRREE